MGLSLKILLVIIGIVLTIVGIVTANWKLAAIGNAVAIGGLLFA